MLRAVTWASTLLNRQKWAKSVTISSFKPESVFWYHKAAQRRWNLWNLLILQMQILIVSIYINMTENSTHLNEPYQSTIVTVIGSYFFWFIVKKYGPSVTSNRSKILNQDSSAYKVLCYHSFFAGCSDVGDSIILVASLCWWLLSFCSRLLFPTFVTYIDVAFFYASAKLTKQNDCISLSYFFTMFKSKFGPLGVILFTT